MIIRPELFFFLAKMSNIKLPSVGSWYESRSDLYDALLHGHMQKGIQKDKRTGLVGIVLSSLYEGDHDEGDHIIYTGEGGKKKTET